jgi:hypothetical protein
MKQSQLFIYDAHIKEGDVEKKRMHYERAGFTFLALLSPEEATSPVDGKLGEIVLRVSHPMP